MSDASTWPMGAVNLIKTSAVPYVGAIVAGVVLGRYAQYLEPTTAWVKGQPPGVVVSYLGALAAIPLWFMYRGTRTRLTALASFLVLMAASWFLHFGLARLHGDTFTYGAFLYPLIFLMLWLKTPSLPEVITLLRFLGWLLVGMFVVTLALELIGVLERPYTSPDLIGFEERNYWLPFSGPLGIDGRWTGPFGHTGDTGAMGALLVVLGLALKRWSGYLFAVVGVFVLLLTSVRTALIAVVVGVAILLLFSRSGLLSRVPAWARIGALAAGVVAVIAVMLGQSSNLTGRTEIWPAFLELWYGAPLIGVGAAGIAANGGLTQLAVHGHNLVVDELARNGIVGMVVIGVVLVIAVVIAFRAALRGLPGPLAILACYFVISIGQAMNDWLQPSVPLVIITLAALWGSVSIQDEAAQVPPSSSVTQSV